MCLQIEYNILMCAGKSWHIDKEEAEWEAEPTSWVLESVSPLQV